MLIRSVTVLAAAAALTSLSGCIVTDSKPLPKINPTQAKQQIQQSELLDVAIRYLNPGVPARTPNDDEALAKRRIFPEVRQAEARYMPALLRSTLESSSQWGAVRVVPPNVEFVDVLVSGKIIESTGAKLALEMSAQDSQGRVWIKQKHYSSVADEGSYKTPASLKARDPFQNVYSQIANDLVAARDLLSAAERAEVRRVTQLKFAQDFAPTALSGYLATADAKTGLVRPARLPASDDPVLLRVEKIRERDATVVDTLDGYNGNFADQMSDSYGQWRKATDEEIGKEDKAKSQARARTALGAAAVLASIFIGNQCGSNPSTVCRNAQDAARYGAQIGGVAAVYSGIKKYGEAKTHAQAMRELSSSYQGEVAQQVVEVQGRTLKLTGTAEEQYREWRKLLSDLYREDSGGVASAPPAAAAAPATAAKP